MRHFYLLCIGVALMGNALFAQSKMPVYFAHGTEFFPENIHLPEAWAVAESDVALGQFARYIQLETLPSDEQKAHLEREGIRFVHYIDQNVYLITAPQGYDLRKLSVIGVKSIVAPKTAWKMHRNLKERPLGTWAVSADGVEIELLLLPHVTNDAGARLLESLGVTILQRGVDQDYLRIRVREEALETIAALPYILWTELTAPPAQKDDTNGRSYHRSNLVDSEHPLGKKYNGAGVNTLVRDDGALGPHIDFQGRLFNQPGAGDPLSGTHGDGVGGIIGGAGNLDPTKKGMAAGAGVYVIDYTSGFQDNTMTLVQQQNVTITNSSYSDGCNAGYTTGTRTVDQQVFSNTKLMHVFSAGNSNNSDCGYGAGDQWGNITGGHKMGKNVIATANLDANGTLAGSSSRGPANDGRLKPDISAHGAGQNSTDPNNTYQVFGGTSAASPGIAGCMAQLTHAYKTINNATQAPTALLKAAMLNTANEMGNVGPDFKYGWGHVNTFRALRLLEQNNYLSGSATNNSVTNLNLDIPAGVAQAKIMLYWADPAASTAAAKALVNDLDLTVISPNGTVTHRPWKLNPTPNPVILDTPAGKGRDSLNNVEQVVIDNPAAGQYTIRVRGFSVPSGPQNFYICWDYLNDGVQLTYPAGGEGFVPGTVEKIRWDALGNTANFSLKYSTNGGTTYTTIATPNNNVRTFDWTVPNTISGTVKLAIIRGNSSDTTDYNLTICPLPTALAVSQVCPDSTTLTWTKIAGNNTLTYDIFRLGAQYMEHIATSAPGAVSMRVPTSAVNQEVWYSVRASGPSGVKGRRTVAIQHPGGLKNCSQQFDVSIEQQLSPNTTSLLSCGATQINIAVKVLNKGQMPVSSGSIRYVWGTNPPVVESLPAIAPGSAIDYTFATPVEITQDGNYPLTVDIFGVNGEASLSDNTSTRTINALVGVVDSPISENFETPALPAKWSVNNPDGGITWSRYAGSGLIGTSGQPTNAYWVDHYSYTTQDQLDFLNLPPVRVDSFDLPWLEFDYTHAAYPGYADGMRVELLTNCGTELVPAILWEKYDPEFADTTLNSEYYPTRADQWNKVRIPLEFFKGEDFVLRFVAVNGYGNSTFLDNVTIKNAVRPVAQISAPAQTCVNTVANITAQVSPGENVTYSWNFGPNATPAVAAGIGPHAVVFGATGNQSVQLITATIYGSDTATVNIGSVGLPVANFANAGTAFVYNFSNNSAGATTFLWNFGDGTTSTAEQPTHTYTTDGVYTVTLIAANDCGADTSVQSLTVVTPPSVSASPSASAGCAPFTVTYNGTVSTNATTVAWAFPGGTPSVSNSPQVSVTYNSPGEYAATLTVSNAAGTATATVTDIVVTSTPTPAFLVNTNNFNAQFGNNSTNADSYTWDFGDGTTSTDASPTHTYTADGTYTVTLTATNDCGTATSTQTVNITTLPVAGFTVTAATVGCAPFTVQYNNTSSGNTAGLTWTFPGGTPATSTVANPVVVYNAPGTYSASLTANNAVGADIYTQIDLISVGTVPSVNFEWTNNGNGNITLVNNTQNALSYQWDFGDGTTSTEATPNHTYSTDGTYTVTLTATNACGSTVATESISISTPPTAGFTTSANQGCAPFTVQFTNASSSNAANWAWSFPGGNPATSTEANPVVVYDTLGNYVAQLKVSNSQGTDSTAQEIVTLGLPGATYELSVAGTELTGQSTSVNATELLWDFGDGNTSTEANPTHTYGSEGYFTVTFTATNACGSWTGSDTVAIFTPVSAIFSTSSTNGCAPFEVQYSNPSSTASTQFAWEFPGGTPSVSNEAAPVVTYDLPGTYSASLTVSNPLYADTLAAADFIVVSGPPTGVSFMVTAVDTNVTFNGIAQNALSYTWNFGDGNSSSELNPQHQYAPGIYTVDFAATNDCGTTIYTQQINLTVGLQDAGSLTQYLQLAPNPTNTACVLSFTQMPDPSVALAWYNATGQLMEQRHLTISNGTAQHTTEVAHWPSGVYWVKVQSGQQVGVLRLVKSE
jgi:PKD repeat protein